MSEFRSGGLKLVEHSSDGIAWTPVAGVIESESDFTVEAIKNQLTNSSSQSGETWTPKINFLDFDDYSTIKGFAVGSGKVQKYWRFTFDGVVRYKTTDKVYPIVHTNMHAQRSEGDISWTLEIELSATEPYEYDPI